MNPAPSTAASSPGEVARDVTHNVAQNIASDFACESALVDGQGYLQVPVVVMGVSGCGKSTLASDLAAQLGRRFVEGDTLHPPANVAKMAAGLALDDTDRIGWLHSIAAELARGDAPVVACSALKRSYRDLLRAAAPQLRLIHLSGEPSELTLRLEQRQGHYMPATLLPSQLATLEPPQADEHALPLDITMLPAQQTYLALAWLHGQAPRPPAASRPTAASTQPGSPPASEPFTKQP